MRNNESNIIFNVGNITLNLENIKRHLTDKPKIITSVLIIIMLGYTNITLTSALSYQSNVGVSFTFNPTLSINISSSDLTIDSLTPGTTSDSNATNVSVATNAAYGYTLSAIMNGDNSNLTHTNGANAFSSIATDASLSNLTTDNTWGYSYKNNLASTPAWSNYSGLSTDTSKALFNTDSNTSSSIGFKIGAKASSTQASGEYTNTINFIAISKPMPKTIEDIAYMQTFGELNATDLNSVKNSMVLNQGYVLKDIRDEKEYYVTRLEDGNVWMTQNLDLDIDSNKTYTHYDTDLGWTTNDPTATWQPATGHSTIDFSGDTVDGWISSNDELYSANPGDIYYYTSNSTADDITYNSLLDCINANHTDCGHYHAGNYYNWSAAVASSIINSSNAINSVCPAGWKLPIFDSITQLVNKYNIISSGDSYSENGFNNLRLTPLYFVRSGRIYNTNKLVNKKTGYLQYSTIYGGNNTRFLAFGSNNIHNSAYDNGVQGLSVRCLAR